MRSLSRYLLAPLPGRSGAVVSVADQAVSSITNFGALIVAARHLDADSFGSFSTVYVIYTLAQAAIQAHVGQELVLHDGPAEMRLAYSAAGIRFSMIAGAGLGAVLLLCAGGLPAISASLVPLALCLPLLMAHEVARNGAAVMRAPQLALALDLAWLALMVLCIAVVTSQTTAQWVISATWYGSGAVAGMLGFVLLQALKPPHDATPWRYLGKRFLGHRFLLETVAVRGVSQALALLLAALAGLAATGAYRGAATLFGPVNILLTSVSMFGSPRIVERGLRESRRMLLPLAGALSLLALLLTAVLWGLPGPVGEMVLGETWTSARALIPAFGVQSVALAFSTVYRIALRVVAPRWTLPLQLATSAATVALFLIGFAYAGVYGAVWGFAGGAVVSAALMVWAYMRAMGRSGNSDSTD